jgi:hypothetical protein
MPDLTLCLNVDCPLKEICERAKDFGPSPYQSYSYFNPDNKEKCEDFLELER